MKLTKHIAVLLLMLYATSIFAQKATEANRPQDTPVDFSDPVNIVLFIVLPIIVIILYFIWRKHKKRDIQKAMEAKKNMERNENYKNRE